MKIYHANRRTSKFFLALFVGGMTPAIDIAFAACVVPNSLTNGQVADASQVMANFDAIAACADTAVAPTGSPTSGTIAVFSGAKTVTSGNLAGDVTTSGSTTTALSTTGVTAGTYASANITVDAKGRITAASNGAGGGGRWWFAPPLAASLPTLVGTVTPTLQDDTDEGLLIDLGTPATGDPYRAALKAIPSPTADWSVAIKINLLSRNLNYGGGGIMLSNSSNSRVLYISVEAPTSVTAQQTTVARGNLPNGFVSMARQDNFTYGGGAVFLRVRHVSATGTYGFDISNNGKQWLEIWSESDTAWLTGRAAYVGIGGVYNRSTDRILMSVPYWAETGL